MITVFISKYCREFTRLREFFGHYNMEFEVVPLQATDQCLTLPDYQNLVRGLGKSEGGRGLPTTCLSKETSAVSTQAV